MIPDEEMSVNAFKRGVRNTFRNVLRTVGVVVILAVAVAPSISMLIARDTVSNKINSVRASTGTSIVVTPKGLFGGEGGATALTDAEVSKAAGAPRRDGGQGVADRASPQRFDLARLGDQPRIARPAVRRSGSRSGTAYWLEHPLLRSVEPRLSPSSSTIVGTRRA